MAITLPDEIRTVRLILCQLHPGDAAAIFDAYTQDLEVARYMVWQPHLSISETEDFISYCCQAWASGEARPYILTLQGGSDIPIGMLEARIYSHTVDIGYVLARKNWGIGLMPEAVAAFTELALAQSACFRVQATCDIENNASARTLEKAGFMREAVLQRYTVHPNISSVSRPCFMYARCK